MPFDKVITSFVDGLIVPIKELGINGMSYSYGGSNINFDTNPSYPIVSVIIVLNRKRLSTVSLSSYPYKLLSAFLREFCSKKRLSLFLSQKQCLDMQLKPFFPSSSLFDGNKSSSLFYPTLSKIMSQLLYQ